MNLGLLTISPLTRLLRSTIDFVRAAEKVLNLAHTSAHVFGIAIALFILSYWEFHSKYAQQFIHNMHTSTMFALTLVKRELCSSADTSGFH